MAGSEFDQRSLEALVNRLIRVEGLPRKDDLDLKIAILALAVEKLQRLRRLMTRRCAGVVDWGD